VFLLASVVAVIVMNLWVPQMVAQPIAAGFHAPGGWIGVIAMLPQLGYAAGLLLLVPLADLHENRRLILLLMTACMLCLLASMAAPNLFVLLVATTLAGGASSAIQILVPLAATLAPPEERGRAVGNMMSGLMAGILLARPLSGAIADLAGWRAVYGVLGVVVGVAALLLARRLPARRPPEAPRYGALLASLGRLLRDEPVLRQGAIVAAWGMGAFSAFWTSAALLLTQPQFGLSPRMMALFALCGAGGVLAAPLAGRAADGGRGRRWSIGGHAAGLAAAAVSALAGLGLAGHGTGALALLAAAALVLDTGITADQTVSRRAINLLSPAMRARLNALYVAVFFVGGGAGSVASGLAWNWGGWGAVCAVQAACSLIALMLAVKMKR
jgi:predicted MFS family arabinose efflux permease